MDAAEQFAEAYVKQRDLRTERFLKAEMRLKKTPDFRVLKEGELVTYCEAKHVQQDTWPDDLLETVQPLEVVGGPRPDPIFNRLTAHIHTAHKQFIAVNPNHDLPNVLVFANSDKQCTYKGDLLAVLTGNFYGDHGEVEHIFGQFSDGRIKFEKMTIDAYVWWNCWKEGLKPSLWFWRDTQHYKTVSLLLGSDPAAHGSPG